MVIETKRLVIHTASLDEMVCFIEKQTDEELIKAYKEMLQGCIDNPQDRNWYAIWFIELKNGTYVGDLCFKGLNADGSVEIGYGISEGYRGQGYASEAVDAAAAWALEQPGVCRVEAETAPENRASQRVLEKCGFVPSGIIGEEGPRFYKTH
ncbi:MAG: GNAT family N-acetyltransferase [Lachnospiraceae bacterium]|nr:GNAT family N-acetyltransferase [Lachnospiraceae bacterium]